MAWFFNSKVLLYKIKLNFWNFCGAYCQRSSSETLELTLKFFCYVFAHAEIIPSLDCHAPQNPKHWLTHGTRQVSSSICHFLHFAFAFPHSLSPVSVFWSGWGSIRCAAQMPTLETLSKWRIGHQKGTLKMQNFLQIQREIECRLYLKHNLSDFREISVVNMSDSSEHWDSSSEDERHDFGVCSWLK